MIQGWSMAHKSKCCSALVYTGGHTTRYWVCSECNKACDVQVTATERRINPDLSKEKT